MIRPCKICGKPDKLRREMCDGHYRKWLINSSPEAKRRDDARKKNYWKTRIENGLCLKCHTPAIMQVLYDENNEEIERKTMQVCRVHLIIMREKNKIARLARRKKRNDKN